MSVVVVVKVYDGIVLASDSAVRVTLNRDGEEQASVSYAGGTKIHNLHRHFPLGAATIGSANLGPASVAALLKDFRRELMDPVTGLRADYTMAEVADRLSGFVGRRYLAEYGKVDRGPVLLLGLAGYGAGAACPEYWEIGLGGAQPPRPVLQREEASTGINWLGVVDPISRLLLGMDGRLEQQLRDALEPAAEVDELLVRLRRQLEVPLVYPPTPIEDALEIARFLVELTAFWERYTPGTPRAGGTVELAAITRHEGFKWTRRKHYYAAELNPFAREHSDVQTADPARSADGADD